MSKFIKDLDNAPVISSDLIFPVSYNGDIRSYKLAFDDVPAAGTSSAVEARLSDTFSISTGTEYVIPFDSVHYDLKQGEFDTNQYAFTPSQNGVYFVNIIVGLGETPVWSNQDRVGTYMKVSDSSGSSIIGSTFHEFTGPTSGLTILGCSAIANIVDHTGVKIQAILKGVFTGGTKNVSRFWVLDATSLNTGYTSFQISRL